MKMSGVFTGGKVVEIGGYSDSDAYINTEEHGFGTDEEGVSEAAIHAINSHDALVEALEMVCNFIENENNSWISDHDAEVLFETLKEAKS